MLPLLLAVLAAAPASAGADETLHLRVGEPRLLEVPGLARVLVEDPAKLDATPLSKDALKWWAAPRGGRR